MSDKTTIEFLSLTTSLLKLYFKNSYLGSATGFFYRKEDALYLVSNWHVFAGRNTYTGQPNHRDGVPVDSFAFTLCRQGLQGINWDWKTFLVAHEDETIDWWQHPTLGQKVDIAVTKIPKEWENLQQYSAETLDSPIELNVGQDVFILGYPDGIVKQGFIPVWKRGSIASEPNLETDAGKVILIDSATRKGMSGSPIFALDRHNYVQDTREEYKRATARRLIGVYSGRYGAEELDSMQLGLCWKTELIDEIIDGKVPGSYQLDRN